ncbi:MAG: hypothetical protein WCP52_13695 [Bacteroidota bacterium]
MKKSYFIFLFCSLIINSFGQENKDTPIKNQRRLYLKVLYCPVYCANISPSGKTRINLSSIPSEGQDYYTFDNKAEKGGFGYEAGLLTEIRIYKGISLNIGILIERLNYKTKANTSFYNEHYSTMGNNYTETRTDINLSQSYQFLSIPLIVNYGYKKNKITYTAGVGVSYDLLTAFNTTETPGVQSGSREAKFIYNTTSDNLISLYPLIVNLGVNYQLYKSLSIGIEPHLRYYFASNLNYYNNIVANPIAEQGFNSQLKLLGLGATIYLKF